MKQKVIKVKDQKSKTKKEVKIVMNYRIYIFFLVFKVEDKGLLKHICMSASIAELMFYHC